MQRRALAQAAAAAAVLAVALAGCTGADGPTGAVDSQSGEAGASSVPAPSGKYSTLPEPCTAVSAGTLEELLPGAEGESGESGEDAEEPLAGEPDLTYDADRLVGCSWERETTEGGHQLELRFERIVSYDDEISDDEQAAQIYAERADEHDVDVTDDPPDLPDKAETGNASGGGPAGGEAGATEPQDGGADGATDAADDGGTDGDGTNGDGTDGAGTPSGTGGSSESPGDDGDDGEGADPAATLTPRLLDGIGDESFLDDRTVGAGKHREVTVVFRTSNVVVTLTYDHWDTAATEPPDTAELQQRAQQVADQLADRLAG
ncbi:hypothetical protein [Streptomyces synnematoformans]|uniref:DUF3558 domain-containing protein n=1 Tax=Streptomyces synnematoformans TaxID=415721 RepID=A0ABN1ZW19_9ACTN